MNFLEDAAGALRLIGFGAGAALASRTLLHYFQLESYQFPGYFKTLRRNLSKAARPGLYMACGALALFLIFSLILPADFSFAVEYALTGVLLAAMGWAVRCLTYEKQAKKKFALTLRVKRLYAVSIIVHALLLAGVMALAGLIDPMAASLVPAILLLLLPLTSALAGLLAWPIEKGISEMYFRDAQRMLRERPDLIKIGITGSYGKTSVKFILGTMLSEKYQTLVTPSSFNTPMGVTKIIRTKLQPAHQVFVAEMGARHVGDIKELCRLVHPTYGLLTSVGPQHLDTFKTIERIKSTKYELMDAIPAEGICFFPDDGAICRELYDKTTKTKRLACLHGGDADVWAEEIAVSARGSSFMLCTRDGRIACETCLLGMHNIQNILLAASVCVALGLSLRQIAHGISRIQPIEHRLQLISNPGGMTIIDDAFNSNPNGANRALDVLSRFPARRIIITPGMVELGAEEAAFNRTFGEKMASCAEIAILVGKKHTAPIREGLLSKDFDAASVHTVASLDEAAALLRQIGRAGDTVLFENDLPDNYTE